MRVRLILAEALSGLRRNASMVISVILVTFVSLTFVGAAMLMQMQIGKMQSYWAERAQVSIVMCRDDSTATTCADGAANDEQRQVVADRLASPALEGIVRDVRFESADEAYQNLIALYGDEYKDYVTPAQLGDTYWVGLVDPGKSDVITEAFTGTQGVEAVKNQMQYLEPLFSALTIATYIAVGIAVQGVYSAGALNLRSRLLFQMSLDWWNFEESVAGFFAHCAAFAGLCMFVTYYAAQWQLRYKCQNY